MIPCPYCGEALDRATPFCPHCAAPLAHVAATATFQPASTPHRLRASTPGIAWAGATGQGLEPGVLLGTRYRIVGLLGRGGMGEVYRADDLKLGQPVALKFLPEGLDQDRSRLERFLSEIRTARQVSHPNVCRVYDVADVDGRHFLSMEYVDGEDLASLLRRIGRLPHDKALEIARQVCAGLAASHERGVVHRDLKPANVMLDGRGKARITDFGLATAIGNDREREIAGTPAYMAPEQLSGGPLTAQTDIYALGLLLFELFTGRRVYDAATLEQLRSEHERPVSATLSTGGGDVDPAVLRVIERCLEADPKRRPAHAIAVAAALPGGDPLAAALAAGETPSPQMVAAAGDSSVLSPRLAATGVAALMAALAVAIALNGHVVYPRFVPLPFSPEVLRTKADDLQMRLGYGGGADAVDGFRMRSDFLDWARATLVDEDPRGELASLAPPMLTFWRHTSPSVIVGDSLGTVGDGPARFSGSAAKPRDVPASVAPVAGATLIELAPDGRLVRFEASPPAFRTGAGRSEEPDWQRLFAAAALDYSMFRPVESTLVSGVHADERRAWQRQPATNARVGPLRVEAGTFEGRIAYFELVAPWTTSHRKRVEWAVPPAMRRGLVTLFIVIAIVGLTLARRNVQLGRSDRRGAARLAGFVGLMTFVATVLATHHVAGSVELGIITGTSAFSLYIAAMTWVFYVALEPFVRRRWPQALVGWTRLLAGGWRDPLVGRELLVGSVAGVVTHALSLAGSVLIERLAGDWVAPWDVANSVKWLALSTPSPALYAAAATLAAAPFFALIGLFILFMMRVALRHEALAALAYVAVLLLLFAGAMTHPPIQLPLSFVLIGIGVFVLTRFGFLAYTAVSFPAVVIAILGVSFDFNVFYGTTMIAGMMLSVAPGLFGAYTALGGRPMFGALLND